METKRTEKRTETHACDFIDRQVALDAVNELIRLLELPFAEPKTGKWIRKGMSINCSVCKKCSWSLSFEDTVRRFNYCPNCGAKMEGEVE